MGIKFLLAEEPADEVLKIFEEERQKETHPDVLTWQLIILHDFIQNFLPKHGRAIYKVSPYKNASEGGSGP